jgi:NitT/TauT family transport system permease protein
MLQKLNYLKNIALAVVLPLAIWQFACSLQIVNPALFPPPLAVLSAAIDMHHSGVLYKDIAISVQRAATGFVLGAVLGIAFGLLTARVHFFSVVLGPLFNLLRPIPAIALVPVAIVWFGIGEESKYFVIAYTVFLAVWLSTHHGMEHVPSIYLRASRSLGASRAIEFLQVVVPASAPHIFAGLRLGAALAFLSLVAAELTGSSAGIGYRIDEARQYILVDRMFVGLIMLGILGATLDTFFVLLSRKLIHWEQA